MLISKKLIHVVGLINRGHAVADQQEIYKITRQYTVHSAVGSFPDVWNIYGPVI